VNCIFLKKKNAARSARLFLKKRRASRAFFKEKRRASRAFLEQYKTSASRARRNRSSAFGIPVFCRDPEEPFVGIRESGNWRLPSVRMSKCFDRRLQILPMEPSVTTFPDSDRREPPNSRGKVAHWGLSDKWNLRLSGKLAHWGLSDNWDLRHPRASPGCSAAPVCQNVEMF